MGTLRAVLRVTGTGSEGTWPSLALTTYRMPRYGGGGPPASARRGGDDGGEGDDGVDGTVDDDTTSGVPVQQVLINCGECTCRLLQEARVKMIALTHVLLTSGCPRAMAGIPSLLFHLSDRGAAEVTLAGTEALGQYYSAVQGFVSRRYPVVEVVDVSHSSPLPSPLSESQAGADVSATASWAAFRAGPTGLKESGLVVKAIPITHERRLHDSVSGEPAAKRSRADAGSSSSSESSSGSSSTCVGICYLITVCGPWSAQPSTSASSVAAAPDASHKSGSDDDSEGTVCSSGSIDSEHDSSSVMVDNSTNAGSQKVAKECANDSASPCSLSGPGSISFLVVDAGSIVGRALLSPSELAYQLASSLTGVQRQRVSWVVHLGSPGAGSGAQASLGTGGTASPSGSGQSHGTDTTPSVLFPRGYQDEMSLLFPKVLHYTVGPSSDDGPHETHFPAAYEQACVLAAVEPALWPLGSVYHRNQTGLPSSETHTSNAPGLRWLPVSARSCIDIATGAIQSPHRVSERARQLATRAREAAHSTGCEAWESRASPSQPANSAAADDNEIDIGDDAEGSTTCIKHSSSGVSDAVLQGPHITLLGTGAAAPSKLRSCSSILVTCTTDSRRLLLDCGEGALAKLELVALASGCALSQLLTSIGGVSISHMHADHHTGLLALMMTRAASDSRSNPLLLTGPPALFTLARAYQRLIDTWLYPGARSGPPLFVWGGQGPDASAAPFIAGAFPWLASWSRVPVDHCRYATADILTLRVPASCPGAASSGSNSSVSYAAPLHSSVVLAYSGDTRPCSSIVEATCAAVSNACASRGWNSDSPSGTVSDAGAPVQAVLVHEATMNDDRVADAAAKKHSTVGEATSVAEQLRLRLPNVFSGTILTHFSQRYPRAITNGSGKHVGRQGTSAGTETGALHGEVASDATGFATPLVPVLAHDGLTVPLTHLSTGPLRQQSSQLSTRLEAAWARLDPRAHTYKTSTRNVP